MTSLSGADVEKDHGNVMLTTYCRLFSTKQGVLDDGRSCFTHNNSFSYLRIYI